MFYIHEELGHFEMKRNFSLLQSHHWWIGMQIDVQWIVAKCQVYIAVCTSFNAPTHVWRPSPITSLGYGWNLDFTRPLSITKRDTKYILVMTKHYSKWIELLALPNNFNKGTTYVFFY